MTAKILYGALFVVLLPIALALWARGTTDRIPLPVYGSPALGWASISLGTVLIVAAWHALWVYGEGLPMNAFPPKRLVTRSVYALIPHPIYGGFVLVVWGASIRSASSAGLWLVTPFVALGSLALLWGYEIPDLDARFADRPSAWLAPPPEGEEAPSFPSRVSAVLLTATAFVALYELVTILGSLPHAITTYFSFEASWPVLTLAYPVYASVYPAALLGAFLPATRSALRRYVFRMFVSFVLVFPLFFFLPCVAPHRAFVPTDLLGHALVFEQRFDSPGGALPSFHVIWALVVATTAGERWPRARSLFFLWAFGVSLACVLCGMHSIVDVAAGLLAGVAVIRWRLLWERLRLATERTANSWYEWRFGSVRFISHGMYAGVGTAVGALITLMISGSISATLAVIACAILGAAIWAQTIEGSSTLLRPYGFYGGMLGIVVGAFAAPIFHSDTWTMLGASVVAAPWVQALGRLRCLVQGCCHGAPASPQVGICYSHPRSRVVRLSPFAGSPIHPTPLYSILGNVVIALIVTRLFLIHAPLPFVGGVYMILGGFARFVEEAYRGETQTPIHRRLRLYQWVALAQVVVGMIGTVLPGPASPSVQFSIAFIPGALFAGIVAAIALGADFPDSEKRYSRLT